MKFNSKILVSTIFILVLAVSLSLLAAEDAPKTTDTAGTGPSTNTSQGGEQNAEKPPIDKPESSPASGPGGSGGDPNKEGKIFPAEIPKDSGSSVFSSFVFKEIGLILGSYIMRQMHI
uniref:Secreted protein n=1 Tax=Parastrongyloides trichosuri TaxID=131310 RepID=A0A0N4Z106_PARTI